MHPAFDTIAKDYDQSFTDTAVGRLLRKRVWAVLRDWGIGGLGDSEHGTPNPPIHQSTNPQALELNCGTGEDAIWLAKRGWQVLATDVSPEMVAEARAKAVVHLAESCKLSESSAGGERLKFQVCSFAEISRFTDRQFDLVFSNFGGLNCVSPEDLQKLSLDLQKLIAPGGLFIAVVMSRFCWQETLYFLLKGKPREAFRRWSRTPMNARLDEKTTVPTWYFSPKELQNLFQIKGQRLKAKCRVHPVGFWLPPSYLNSFFEKHPRLLRLLNFLEKNFSPSWVAPAADHFLICLENSSDDSKSSYE